MGKAEVHTSGLWLSLALLLSACQPSQTPAAVQATLFPTSTAAPASIETATPGTAHASATAKIITPVPERPPTQASIGDPYYPELGNGGYDVDHYTLDLTVDVSSKSIFPQPITGTMTMTATATSILSAFNLDLYELTVTDVAVAGRAARFSHNPPELTIMPAEPIAAGTPFTTTIAYTGTPRGRDSIALTDGPYVGWIAYKGGVYVSSFPEGAATWFPVNNHPRDKATYTFRVTVPKPYVVAANGTLQETIDHGATTTYIWEARQRMASYLASVTIGEFVMTTATGPNNLPLRSFVPPRVQKTADRIFGRTSEMIEYFSTVFGPYPFEAYGVVVPDTVTGSAQENQTLSLFGLDELARPTPELLAAHELAHQWFGNSISVRNWQDIWLNESFASYAEWLWLEHTGGRQQAIKAIRLTYGELPKRTVPPAAPPVHDLINRDAVYARGALALEALRQRIGDDHFLRTLRAYADRYHDSNASTVDFIAVAEEVSGQQLDDFFNAWLYSEELPPIPELGLRREG